MMVEPRTVCNRRPVLDGTNGVCRLVVAALVAGMAVGCSKSAKDEVGADTWQAVAAAEKVELIRLTYGSDLTSLKPGAPLFGAKPVGKPSTPPAAWVEALRGLLASPDTFEWDAAKGCLPTPGVAVRFTTGGREVELLICYECGLLAIGPTPPDSGGPPQRWLDFERARAAFVRLAKEAFPADKEIQALPD